MISFQYQRDIKSIYGYYKQQIIMDVKQYYKENVSYSFNKDKQQGYIDNYSDDILINRYKLALQTQRESLYDMVNTPFNVKQYLLLLKENIDDRGISLKQFLF